MVTKEMIKNSMEGQWRKRQIILLVISGVICTIAIGEIFFIGLGLILLYQLFQYFLLFNNYKQYEVCKVTLNRPATSIIYKRSVYYTVSFTTKSGQNLTHTTKPIWSDSFFGLFRVAAYSNSKIRVAYNEEKDKLIVLGR